MARFWWNFKGRFLVTPSTDPICHGDSACCYWKQHKLIDWHTNKLTKWDIDQGMVDLAKKLLIEEKFER